MIPEGELIGIYKSDFLLCHEHHFDLSYIDNVTPLEREIYIKLLSGHLEKKAADQKAAQQR